MQWIIEDIKASNLAELRVGGCEGKGRGVLVWKFLGSTLSPATLSPATLSPAPPPRFLRT